MQVLILFGLNSLRRSLSMFTGLSNTHMVNSGEEIELQLSSKNAPLVLQFGYLYTQAVYKRSLFAPHFPPCLAVGTWAHLDSPSRVLVWQRTRCHGVHWLSYLPIYHSWIGTSLAWNLLSDFVRVTWDAWCCNCWAFRNGGSIANVFRVILTYRDTSHVTYCISLAWDNNDN